MSDAGTPAPAASVPRPWTVILAGGVGFAPLLRELAERRDALAALV